MQDTVTVEIPERWLEGLDLDRASIIEDIIRLGVHELRVRRALELYQAGFGSLGYLAEKTRVPKRTLIGEARARNIEPAFDEQTVNEELGV